MTTKEKAERLIELWENLDGNMEKQAIYNYDAAKNAAEIAEAYLELKEKVQVLIPSLKSAGLAGPGKTLQLSSEYCEELAKCFEDE